MYGWDEPTRESKASWCFPEILSGEKSVWGWRDWTNQQIKLSTYHLIMVIIASQSGNTPACRDDLSGESQDNWGTFCKVLPASTQRGLGRAQWASFSKSFYKGKYLGAFLVERNICLDSFTPSGLHPLWDFSGGNLGPLDITPLSLLEFPCTGSGALHKEWKNKILCTSWP